MSPPEEAWLVGWVLLCASALPAQGETAGNRTCNSLYEQALFTVGMLHGGALGGLIAGKVESSERDVHDQLQPAQNCLEDIPSSETH